MRLLEYQAKAILSSFGVKIPGDVPALKLSQLNSALKKAGKFPLVLKVQVYAGGRGKAGGIIKVKNASQARQAAKELFAKRIVTPQTGPEGVAVKGLLLEQGITILKEFYVSILLDRSLGLPVVVASKEGGVAIEELAKSNPKAIFKTPFDPLLGLMPYQARRIVGSLEIPRDHRQEAGEELLKLSRAFFQLDASLIEINPWALTKELGICAVDAKVTLDDNGLFRNPELLKLKAADSDTPIEARSKEIGISYVGLTGAIGCMVNGAGLAMATMDLIKLHGGEPANFLDVGGGSDVNQVREAFKLILADSKVKAVLVNIFGGIMKCDVIAQGILSATKTVKVKVPLVVRLEGTNVELGRKLLKDSKLGLTVASDLKEAAQKAVAAAQGSGRPGTF